MMLLGYNTNGFAHHDPQAALELLAEIGYGAVALTLDHGLLNPYDSRLEEQLDQVQRLLNRLGLRSVIETGARYLLDPRVKHEPTLLSADKAQRARRIDFLCRAVDIARRLQSDCVSLWSGVLRTPIDAEAAFARLAAGLRQVLDYAAQQGVTIGFEPEPGMLVATLADYQRLLQQLDAPHFQLTLDVGHLHCLGETPIAEQIRRWRDRIVNLHIEDMRAGVHEHLRFGEGEIDFPPVLQALAEIGYRRGIYVELSRHSHDAPQAAEQAYQFLTGQL